MTFYERTHGRPYGVFLAEIAPSSPRQWIAINTGCRQRSVGKLNIRISVEGNCQAVECRGAAKVGSTGDGPVLWYCTGLSN